MSKISLIDTLLAVIVMVSVLLSGCVPAALPMPTATALPAASTPEPVSNALPRLRIKNSGTTDIKNLVIQMPDTRLEFGDVPAGQTTEYQTAPNGVYDSPAYEFDHNGATVEQRVRDWVGASPLPGQSYTYEVTLDLSKPADPRVNMVQVMADINE